MKLGLTNAKGGNSIRARKVDVEVLSKPGNFQNDGVKSHHARQLPGALQQPELRGLGQLHGGRLPAGGLAGTGWARPPTW